MRYFEYIKNNYVVFRIIPHHSVLNNANRKFLHQLHNVFSIYDKWHTRIWKEGLKIFYRQKDDFYYCVSIEGSKDNINNQVIFYIAVPEHFAEVFKIKFNNYEQWKRCTIEEADKNIFIIPDDADIYRLKYQRSNIFSLATEYNRQTVPIREIVNISQEITGEQKISLVCRCEVVSRKRWKTLSDYAWDIWNKGKVPTRNNIDVTRLWRSLWNITGKTITEIKSIIDDVMMGIEKTFMSGKDEFKINKKELTIPNPERDEILVNGELSHQTRKKRNLPVFRTDMFIVSKAETEEKKSMLVRSIAGAFNEMAADNLLNPIKVNIRFDKNKTVQELPKDNDAMMMSVDELGKIIQLPTREVQEEYADVLTCNKNIETEIPKAFTNENGLYVGDAEFKGKTRPVYLPVSNIDMLMTARAFIGSPRMGKDQMAINMVVEAKRKHGIGAVIPDVIDERNNYRGMADSIRDHLPAGDVIDLNLGDYDWPVYIGLDGITENIKNQRIAVNRIASELTNFLMGNDMENHQTREYLREAAKVTGGDLMGIKLLFMSKKYRNEKIKTAEKMGIDVSIWRNYNNMSDAKQGQIYSPIMTRLGELLGDEVLKPIFCQKPNPALQIRKWIEEGKVIIYRIPSRDMGEWAVKTLTHWIVLSTFLIKLSLGSKSVPTYLILNEPHQFLSDGLIHFCKRLLAEGSKHHIAPIFLFHNFKQLPSDFVEILLSSSLNWHIFKNTNDNVYKRLENYITPTFTPEIAMKLTKRFQYIACFLDQMGEYQLPFMVNAPPLVGKRYPTQDNSFLTKRHSRAYGRAIQDVIREIDERHKILFA